MVVRDDVAGRGTGLLGSAAHVRGLASDRRSCCRGALERDALATIGQALVELERAHQLVDDLLAHATLNGVGDAGGEMVAQEDLLHPLQAGLHGAELLHQVNAVGVVVDHAAHTLQVAGRHLEAERRLTPIFWFHACSPGRTPCCLCPVYSPTWGGVRHGAARSRPHKPWVVTMTVARPWTPQSPAGTVNDGGGAQGGPYSSVWRGRGIGRADRC